jgi:transposase
VPKVRAKIISLAVEIFSMKRFLPSQERENLKLQHRSERDKRVCDRIKAVLLFDDGWDCKEIAHVLLLSADGVKRHIQDYRYTQKLKPENGGSCCKLTAEQVSLLVQHLQRHTYLYVKDIVAYVLATFEVRYTVQGMTDWLHAHGFSYKKPSVIPGKANREAQEQWLKQYKELKAGLQPDEAICFTDGVHPTHNSKPAYGWIRRGERKELPTNTGRQRLNLSGAIDIVSKRVFVREDKTLNSFSTIAFLRDVEAAYPQARKIYVFCDNAKYYRNKDVQAYLGTSKIEMLFLPPYSPNLNPIERLWKFVNEHVLYNKYYKSFDDFREAVLGFLQNLFNPSSGWKEALDHRITDNLHISDSCKKMA